LNTIPYRDEVATQEVVSDGFSTASTVYPNSPSVTVTSLKYNFNNNTAFPLGGQVCTVTGTAFRDNVKVYVGDTETIVSLNSAKIVSGKLEITPPAYYQEGWKQTLSLNKKVRFKGTTFGGLSVNTDYYIKTVENHPDYGSDNSVKTIARITVGVSSSGGAISLIDGSAPMQIEYDSSTYINENNLLFITPGKSVGAYDLVIFNPAKTVPFVVPATSRVVPLAIKYVQILLPFAPLPNPRTATGWYKETEIISASAMQVGRGYKINTFGTTDFTQLGASSNSIGTEFIATAAGTGTGTVLNYTSIPAEYWESMDIEVFVGGRRLRKTPIAIYDETLGPDSVTGNRMLEAEFAVNKNVGAYVRLTDAPDPGVKIIVQKRIGRSWTSPGVDLTNATTDQAKFIRAKGVDLSE
jgi:hypothetical protein